MPRPKPHTNPARAAWLHSWRVHRSLHHAGRAARHATGCYDLAAGLPCHHFDDFVPCTCAAPPVTVAAWVRVLVAACPWLKTDDQDLS